MSPEERADLPSLSLTDAVSREKTKESFYKKYPNELQRRRQADLKAQKMRKK